MTEVLVLLRGGSRDGETTQVAWGVRRLLTPSEAPGLLDVYESTEEEVFVRGNDEEGTVFAFVGQQPAEGIAPDLLHAPPERSG